MKMDVSFFKAVLSYIKKYKKFISERRIKFIKKKFTIRNFEGKKLPEEERLDINYFVEIFMNK